MLSNRGKDDLLCMPRIRFFSARAGAWLNSQQQQNTLERVIKDVDLFKSEQSSIYSHMRNTIDFSSQNFRRETGTLGSGSRAPNETSFDV